MTENNPLRDRGALKVAVIGLGEAGGTIHLPALRRLNDAVVVGAADPDENRRRVGFGAFNIPVFASVGDLFASTQPDLVVVASPPSLHAEHCIASIDAGANVLCEKPFAASVAEARNILAYAEAKNRQISVNHEFRAMPIYRDLIRAVREDAGGATIVQVWQAVSQSPAGETGWRGNLKRRGLYEAGVHLIDLALQLFGETPYAVSASFASASGSSSEPDAIALVTLRFSGGRLGQIMQRRVHRGDRQYLEVRADTREASYRASFGGRARLSAGMLRSPRPHVALERGGSGIAWREQGANRVAISRNGSLPLVAATADVIQSCVTSLKNGMSMPFPAQEGLDALRVIAAAYASAEVGRVVVLDESADTESMSLTEGHST